MVWREIELQVCLAGGFQLFTQWGGQRINQAAFDTVVGQDGLAAAADGFPCCAPGAGDNLFQRLSGEAFTEKRAPLTDKTAVAGAKRA